MTPKEKAEELVAKFEWYCEEVMEYQKACALIAVDEIIYNISGLEDSVWYNNASGFWEEVKQEIEKL